MAAPTFNIKTNNIVADLSRVVDPEWKIVGQAPNGLPVYREMRPKFTNVPDIDPETGRPRYKTHELNGNPMYPLRRVKRELVPFDFTLVDPGNGNVRQEPYREPTPAERRELDMARRKQHLLADLVQGMAERDIDVGTLLDAVFSKSEDGAGDDDGGEPVSYPVNHAPGRWTLSSGTKMKGTREEAEAAEAALAPPPGF